ncbi:hypothetical protein Aph01nite_32800 [Acrocarpospora phusangensis]|uniref:HTH tetR-type domain-containing protein n=1 Tax=Acrocarpospora phusangensis TaxID=1070424 RepID=A0A919QE95_9ACTN|nr:TetR/AcrR family transcriptional regulator [Acrocarpospora phusangensis]GIH24970.1 hypothetical protein Aph01nite_32800 [Acrocarpospora phusangensis]
MGNDARRPQNKRGSGGQLREDIVRAAARLVEQGDGTPTLRAVAREAGITAPAIYAHFDNLDEVLQAVVLSTFQALTAHLRGSVAGLTDPVERLRAACRGYVRFAVDRPQQYGLLFTSPLPEPPPDPGKLLETMEGAEAFAFLLDAIRECAIAGRSHSDDLPRDAIALWVGLHGYISLHLSRPHFPWPPAHGIVDTLIDAHAHLNNHRPSGAG